MVCPAVYIFPNRQQMYSFALVFITANHWGITGGGYEIKGVVYVK